MSTKVWVGFYSGPPACWWVQCPISMKNQIFPSLAARSMQDLALEDDITRPDFELGRRDFDLSKELTRLSLLGIAGYGFLIKEVALKGDVALPFLGAMVSAKWITATGVISLGVAAASSLYLAQAATHCLDMQVEICRLLQRRSNDGWTPEERLQNDRDLEAQRFEQRRLIRTKRRLLRIAVLTLVVGSLMVAGDFTWMLCHVAKSPNLSSSTPGTQQER
jgi:hypothetical protein